MYSFCRAVVLFSWKICYEFAHISSVQHIVFLCPNSLLKKNYNMRDSCTLLLGVIKYQYKIVLAGQDLGAALHTPPPPNPTPIHLCTIPIYTIHPPTPMYMDCIQGNGEVSSVDILSSNFIFTRFIFLGLEGRKFQIKNLI